VIFYHASCLSAIFFAHDHNQKLGEMDGIVVSLKAEAGMGNAGQ
jgi:hypothetical protein